MIVWVLVHHVDYEGDSVLRVYASEEAVLRERPDAARRFFYDEDDDDPAAVAPRRCEMRIGDGTRTESYGDEYWAEELAE